VDVVFLARDEVRIAIDAEAIFEQE